MAFTDHKIAAFTHTISDLADQPNLPPDELKARFDACPEELRQAVNAICDEAAALDGKVSGIITGTFGDTIPKSMLSEELQAELDAKATQTALSMETTLREEADATHDAQISALETALPQKCEIEVGYYFGNGSYPRTFELGYHPKAILIMPPSSPFTENGNDRMALLIEQRSSNFYIITETGFTLRSHANNRLNDNNSAYFYVIFR